MSSVPIMVSDGRRVCARKRGREDKSGRAERDSRNSKSAKSHGNLPFMLGGAAAPLERPLYVSDRSALLTRKIRVGHECVRPEIVIVFGGERSRDDTLTLNLTSVGFRREPPEYRRAASHIIATAVRSSVLLNNSSEVRAQCSENAGVSVGWDLRPRRFLRHGGHEVNKPTCRKIRRRPILDPCAVVRATMRWWPGARSPLLPCVWRA